MKCVLRKDFQALSRRFIQTSSANYGKSLRIGVIGVPFSKGQLKEGVENGPKEMRSAGVIKELISMGHDVKDYGDIVTQSLPTRPDVPEKLRWLPEVAQCTEKLSSKVQEIMKDGRLVLTLGGDHSVALGSVDGHIKSQIGAREVSVLWVDAHADVNTVHTTETGSMHGMPVALLMKELETYWPYLSGLEWQYPRLTFDRLAYIGLRSVDDYERLILDKFSVTAFGMEDIDKYGIHEVTRIALDKINPGNSRSLHVSFDIDSLDELEAPSTGTPVRGGLTMREALHVMEVAYRTGQVRAIDLVEVNPLIGSPSCVRKTVNAAIQVIKAIFNHPRTGRVPAHIRDIPGNYAPLTP